MSTQNISKKEKTTGEILPKNTCGNNKITNLDYIIDDENSQAIWENPFLIERIKKLPVGSFFRLAGQLYCRQDLAYACDWQLFVFTNIRFKLGKHGRLDPKDPGEEYTCLCLADNLYKNPNSVCRYHPDKDIIGIIDKKVFLDGADLLGVPVREN